MVKHYLASWLLKGKGQLSGACYTKTFKILTVDLALFLPPQSHKPSSSNRRQSWVLVSCSGFPKASWLNCHFSEPTMARDFISLLNMVSVFNNNLKFQWCCTHNKLVTASHDCAVSESQSFRSMPCLYQLVEVKW